MSSVLLSPRWRAVDARCRLPAVWVFFSPPGFFPRVMRSWKRARDEGGGVSSCALGAAEPCAAGAGPPPQSCGDEGKGLGITGQPLRPVIPGDWGQLCPRARHQLPANDAVMELSLSNLSGDTCTAGG